MRNFREDLIARICSAPSAAAALEWFRLSAPLLGDCRILFAAHRGPGLGLTANREFSQGMAVRSLFRTGHVLALDCETLGEMDNGNARIPFDYSISLDTQAVSYLTPFLENRTGALPRDFAEVFHFIALPEVNVDPMPYMMENVRNLRNDHSATQILRRLWGYEVLRTLDQTWLERKGEARSSLCEAELATRAEQLLGTLYGWKAKAEFMRALRHRHSWEYCLLLKMACIQISMASASPQRKLHEFVRFCHDGLATLGLREIALAHSYFTKGQKLTFFGKVQMRKMDLFAQLDAMAWDLLHVRHLESALSSVEVGARYHLSAILTSDRRLIEIMDLYPLRACAFFPNTERIFPFYGGDLRECLNIDDDGPTATEFFTTKASAIRNSNRDAARSHLPSLIRSIEADLTQLAKVPAPADLWG